MDVVVIIIIILIIIYVIYTKYPQYLEFKSKYVEGKFIRLEREDKYLSDVPINYANIIFIAHDGSIINPVNLYVYPALAFGDGSIPMSKPNDPFDIVLVETTLADSPVIEYTLPHQEKIANVIIINRPTTNLNRHLHVEDRMKYVYVNILDEKRELIFTHYISETKPIYSINTHNRKRY